VRSIAGDLNDRGILSATGGKWSGETLRKVLISARISGRREHYGQITPAQSWDAIIPPADSDQLRELLTRRKGRPRADSRRYLLSGILTCEPCGSGLYGQASRPGSRARHRPDTPHPAVRPGLRHRPGPPRWRPDHRRRPDQPRPRRHRGVRGTLRPPRRPHLHDHRRAAHRPVRPHRPRTTPPPPLEQQASPGPPDTEPARPGGRPARPLPAPARVPRAVTGPASKGNRHSVRRRTLDRQGLGHAGRRQQPFLDVFLALGRDDREAAGFRVLNHPVRMQAMQHTPVVRQPVLLQITS
jgi:hypothetical protein